MKKIAFLFPGQGAQKVGMGRDIYDAYSVAKETFDEADEILGRSLSRIVFEGPTDVLTETRNSQSGIYVASVAFLRVIQQLFPDLKPFACAGLSLGEYTALTASGRLSFDQCLSLVEARGTFMNEACLARPGTMAAIFGLPADEVEKMVVEIDLPDALWAANFNCPGQTVISGTLAGVEAGIRAAKELGAKRVIPLKVHGAFHSGLMELARQKLTPHINRVSFKEGNSELLMNVPGNFVQNDQEIAENLSAQVTHPVRWQESMEKLKDVDLFVEIGPGRTLAGMNRQMQLGDTLSINTIRDLEKLDAVGVS